jgi:hypothetical protein
MRSGADTADALDAIARERIMPRRRGHTGSGQLIPEPQSGHRVACRII